MAGMGSLRKKTKNTGRGRLAGRSVLCKKKKCREGEVGRHGFLAPKNKNVGRGRLEGRGVLRKKNKMQAGVGWQAWVPCAKKQKKCREG